MIDSSLGLGFVVLVISAEDCRGLPSLKTDIVDIKT
jgi:hypothetical protein